MTFQNCQNSCYSFSCSTFSRLKKPLLRKKIKIFLILFEVPVSSPDVLPGVPGVEGSTSPVPEAALASAYTYINYIVADPDLKDPNYFSGSESV